MNQEQKPVVAPDQVGMWAQLARTVRLVWRLLNDARVPFLPKLIIPAAFLYVVSPIDLIPDMILGLGQLDDVGIVVLAVALFIEFCPRVLVDEHRRAIAAMAGLGKVSEENVIDGSYREVHDDDSK
jgi:uncharacterized membrane protein YkvA (DUF1232 family)